MQAQTESTEPAAVQERDGRGGGRWTGSRAAGRSAASGPRNWRRRRRRRRSLRGPTGSRGVALAAAQSPADEPWPGADDRGTKSRGPPAGPSATTRTTATTCTQGKETAAAASPRLSRLSRPEVDTARPGQAVAGGPGRLPDAARPSGQVAGGTPVDRCHRPVVRRSSCSGRRWRQQPATAAKREQPSARQSPAAGHAERPDHEPAASLTSHPTLTYTLLRGISSVSRSRCLGRRRLSGRRTSPRKAP